MLAYAYSTNVTKTRPRANVVVQVALNTDGAVPVTDPMNRGFREQIASWNAVSDRTWLWGYQVLQIDRTILPCVTALHNVVHYCVRSWSNEESHSSILLLLRSS